ncbi:TPA: restriction endonuclease subunit S [Vibrio cholerae]
MISTYPTYKRSDIEWMEHIPSHWDELKGQFLLRKKDCNVGDAWISTQLLSLTQRGVIKKDINSGKGKTHSDYSTYQFVEKGDLIFCLFDIDETPRTVGLSSFEGMITSAYSVFEAINDNDKKYLYYFFEFVDNCKGLKPYYSGMRKTVRPVEFLKILLPKPPKTEQKAIATFLDRETQRIDSLIEEKQTFIKLLKEKRQALISHVVTKGLNPNVEMQDSGIEWIGQVPKHWEVKKIKHICSNFMYGTSQDCNQSDVGYPVLRIPNIKSTNVDFEDLKYANISDVDALTYLLSRGDILVIRTNGNPNLVGQSALFDSNGQYLFASYLIKLTPKRGVDTSFLVEAMNSLSVRQALTFQSRTSVGNYNLSIPSLANTSIAIPPIDEQKTITNYLSAATINIDLLIQETDKSIDLLKEHRTSLISAAVTGKIDVREAV